MCAFALVFGCDRKDKSQTPESPATTTQPASAPSANVSIEAGSPGMKRYVNRDAQFSIEIPRPWPLEKKPEPAIVQAISPSENLLDTFSENVYVMKKRLIAGATLDMHLQYLRDNIATVTHEGEIKDSGEMEVAAERCAWIIVNHTINETRCKAIRYFFLRGQDLYEITFTSTPSKFNEYRMVFDKIAASFRLL